MKKKAWYYKIYSHLNYDYSIYETDAYDGDGGYSTKESAMHAAISSLSDIMNSRIKDISIASNELSGIAISLNLLSEGIIR